MPTNVTQPWQAWDNGREQPSITPLALADTGPVDPAAQMARADEFFSNGQYEIAADLYGQLLALGVLEQGVTVDPQYQRILAHPGLCERPIWRRRQGPPGADPRRGTGPGRLASPPPEG